MTDMLELYQFSERQFLEFDEIVPMRLNKNRNVVSPKPIFSLDDHMRAGRIPDEKYLQKT